MYGVVLAAGRGTRMRPLTDRRPKPLLPVGDRSLLAGVLDACRPVVDEFVIVTGYRGAAIEDAIGDSYAGAPVNYVEQADPAGTAHAVLQAKDVVDDDFLVVNGDVVIEESLPRSLAEADGTAIAVTEVEDPRSYGVVSLADGGAAADATTDAAATDAAATDAAATAATDGNAGSEHPTLETIVEKPADPPTNLANVGCYAFEADAFDALEATGESERGEFELTETLERLLAGGTAISVVEYDGRWLDVGRPWELLEATEAVLEDLEGRVDGEVAADATLEGAVVVEAGARVRSGVTIEGPAIVRSGAEVGPNAYVRGSTVIGPDARIGHAVEVKNSVVMADTAIGHLSYVGDSVIDRQVNFGAGTVVANLRHDDATVRMTVKGERVDTGRRKFGVVLGEGVKTGIDTNLNAGVVFGVEETTAPGETVTRDRR
ncbi:bifunctional sugar-1-phosphate nucleotidylyltransferase/acetyltransferase [Halopenitus persicus]|uniref:bifunctional sugar-1-phosphate nucleotidylyltransferase/acetyltransferase n=1 Tax=Halopenitus persicus TaxID=1048396 RepID=UPI000BBAECE1|nr:bifunctional sugar-1-phosphate nucleotidylyltransferase/acetyltransferase [Halopenitus persicus]